MTFDLISVMDASASIVDLESKLRGEKQVFRRRKQFLKWLENEWKKIKKPVLEEIANTVLDSKPVLPTVVVDLPDARAIDYTDLYTVGNGQ
ncbi:hypothetical protein COV18_04520 [Candidatus Woesearchaeota archaeon CG10_big_fil_rev_8_21_14_0_10_37_12]|nr:MAG: hypothetical protein COV18_04520 [Candidatus Woesearchaeota archaeon CG10_big_fil_rev_8_21_14_0_10_37_12]